MLVKYKWEYRFYLSQGGDSLKTMLVKYKFVKSVLN